MFKTKTILILLLIVAFFLRIYRVDQVPPSVYGDEQSFAYNAWSILRTGTDEYGNFLPLQFKAFGDYKAPLPVYLLVPFFHFLGMNVFSTRLPVVLFSILTVFFMFLLTKHLTKNTQLSLLAALLLAISPWHIHLSRGFFEAAISLCFFVAGIYFFYRAWENKTYMVLSALSFLGSIYSYFTPRIIVPLVVLFLIILNRKWLITYKKNIILFILVLGIGVLPLLKLSFFDEGSSRIYDLTRARGEKIVKEVNDARNRSNAPRVVRALLYNKPFFWVRDVGRDYVEHFSPNFLFLYGDNSLRYFLGNTGMLFLIELPLLIFGFLYLLKKHHSLFMLVIFWLLVAPLPAAIAGRPFAVRSLALLPPLLIVVACGIYYLLQFIKMRLVWVRVALVSIYTISFLQYLTLYHIEYPKYAVTWWGWENKAAIELALHEQDTYEQIFISNFYTGAELAFAYYTQYDPVLYRQAKSKRVMLADGREMIRMGKFYFGSLDINEQRKLENIIPPKSLYIGRPEEAESDEVIRSPDDGRILFKIYRTN